MAGERDKIAGRVKQAAGDLTDNEELEREGKRDEAAGKVKDKVDEVGDRISDAVDDVKDRFDS